MQGEAIDYRGYTLAVDYRPPHWLVAIRPRRPDQTETNLPYEQDTDRERALERARALVDALLDGPPLGEFTT
jgi:hypothetical protein